MAEGTSTNQPENPRPPAPPQKGKLFRVAGEKMKKAGKWIDKELAPKDPPGYKSPEPLSFKSVGKLVDIALGSEESTKASKNFMERWRGRLKAIKTRRRDIAAYLEEAKKENLEAMTEEQRDADELGFFDVFNKENVDIERLIDLRDAIMSGLLGGLLGTYWRPTIKGEAILKLREKRLRRQNK